jgi:hypothetical protein
MKQTDEPGYRSDFLFRLGHPCYWSFLPSIMFTVGFEDLKAAAMNSNIFWYVTSCDLLLAG